MAHLGGVQQLQTRHSVLYASVIEGAQGMKVSLVKGQYQAAHPGKGHLELFADVPGHPVALHVEPGHEGARLRVVPGVDDGAVGLGGAIGYIVLSLQDGHVQGILGQVIGGGRPHHPTAQNDDVIHEKDLPSKAKRNPDPAPLLRPPTCVALNPLVYPFVGAIISGFVGKSKG